MLMSLLLDPGEERPNRRNAIYGRTMKALLPFCLYIVNYHGQFFSSPSLLMCYLYPDKRDSEKPFGAKL